MAERKRLNRNVVITDDISDTGLTKEEFDIVSEHYSNNDNILENKSTSPRQVFPEKHDGAALHEIEESIVTTLSKHNNLNVY